jgi:hypothetical protein
LLAYTRTATNQVNYALPYILGLGSLVVHRKDEQVFPIFTKGKQPQCYSAWGACMTRAGSRHGAWDQHFLFSPRQPFHSINHMFYSGTLAFMTFFFRMLTLVLNRLIRLLTTLTYTLCYAYSLSFKTKRTSYTTTSKIRDHSSTLKALQLTPLAWSQVVGWQRKEVEACCRFFFSTGNKGRHRSLLHARRCCCCWMSWFRGAIILLSGTIEGTD